ncbi:uncharacterized protein LOC144437871 [Glandiceps talaboti]
MKKFLRSSLRRKTPSPDRKGSPDGRYLGYDVKEKELPKLHKAAWNGDMNKMKQLAKKGDLNQLDKDNRTPLHLACARGQTDVVQFLITNKAKLNICDNGQNSPLMKAVQGDHVQCVRMLLDHGADPNLVDRDGMTALHLAAHTGSADSVSLLLDNGAMVNATNKDGRTPLHLSTFTASDDVVELLLLKDANVNATDKDQRTPLMYACESDQISIVKLLLESKADTEIKDSKGWTAADHAVMNAHHGCSHLINEHSAAHRARPASRQGGMFRAPGTPAAAVATSTGVDYGLGSPAADNEEDIMSQEEESVSKMTYSHSPPGGDSWGDTSEADDTYGGQATNQVKTNYNLSKFVPASDTESIKSIPGTKSRIPRAISKESITSVGSKKATPIDTGNSKIPRLQPMQGKGGTSPNVTPRHENIESPRSDFAPTPRSNKSAGDTEAESIIFDGGDDFLDLSESINSEPPVKVSPYKLSTVGDSPNDADGKGKPSTLVNGNIDMDEEKNKKATFAAELGLDDVDDIDFDEDDSQMDVIPMMEDDDPKSPTTHYPPVMRTGNPNQGDIDMKTTPAKINKPKDDDDEDDDDWDSDTDLLPSHASSRKGGSAVSTPRGYPFASSAASTPRADPIAKSSPKAIPLGKESTVPTKQAIHLTGPKSPRSEDVVDFSEDDETEETESEWEKERKAEKERKELEKQLKEDEEKEKQRMLQWEKEDQEKKDREERELREALEKEETEQKEKERQRLEEERIQQDDDMRKRQEEERKREAERKREEEKIRQEEERRREEERKRDEERRRANFQRLEEERRQREEEDRKRMAEEERRNAERRRKMDEERWEAEKRRQEEQKKQEEKWRENQRKLEEEKRKLEEDMIEQERKRELERKRIAEQFHKSYDDKINDFDDSASDSWSNQPSPVPFRPSSGFSNRSISPRQPYTPGSANPSWKQMLTEEADGLSFSDTDTEGDGIHSYVSTPLPKSVTSPPPPSGTTDPNMVVQMQETLRDHKRQIDKERSSRITIETRIRKLEMEKSDLERKIDKLSHSKTTLEQEKMELETKVRNINYKLTEETEKASSAESLFTKTKDQLDRKEQQYIQELEARQKLELSSRTLQMELREALTTIKQLEEDKSEARKELAHERSARTIQEQLNQDHSKVQDALQQDVERFEEEKAEIFSRLESADENRKFALDQSDRLKAELYGLKMELERVRMRYKDDQGMLAVENEELNNRIEELRSDIRLNEEALAHATMTYNAHLGAAKNENSLLAANLEKEKSANEKLHTEVQSLTSRLTTANHELDKTQNTKSDIERSSQRERDDMQRTIERLEIELSHLRDSVQSKSQTLGSAESRVKSLEHELHLTNLQLTERTGMLSSAQRELEQRKSMLDSVQKELMKEKEDRVKIETRFEAASDRLSNTQTEMSQLKYESTDVHGKFENLLSSLKADHGKNEATYLEKNKSLSDMVEKLNNDLSKAEDKHNKQEQHISQLQQELADVIKKLSAAEAKLESSEKECTQLLRDKEVHANIHDKLIGSESERMQLQHQITDLQNKLEGVEKNLQDTSVQLLDAKARLELAKEVEDNLHQVEIEKTKVTSSLQHETRRVEMLEKELEDSQKVRSSLEALVANLKSANIHMEDRLSEETAARSLYAREAEDHKALWDSEVKSRSKLGLRIAQLERTRTEVSEQVSDEKKRTRKVAEMKRQADAKAEAEGLRNQHLQKEINLLKSALKSAKRKLKELESPDMLIKTLRSDYDQERKTFGDTLHGLRRQNEDLARQLQVENDMRASLESSNRQLQQELAAVKNIKKEKEKLEKTCKKMQDQLGKIKSNLGTGFVEKSEMDRFKQEVETQARQEINQKLEEVNAYLEEQAQARDRLDNIRSNNEAQMKNDYERQVNDYRADVARMKAGHQESLVQKETAQAEAQRYKELYENELKMRQKLSDQLENSNDKLSDAKAQLSLEKQRNRHRIENGFDLGNSYVTPGSATIDPMTQKVRNELDKSIARHLGTIDLSPSIDMRENTPNNWSSPTGPNASPLDKANSQYMSILKKNYFV